MKTSNNLKTIKQQQRDNWNALSDVCLKWEELFEIGAKSVNKTLFEQVNLKEGQRVLDIATGIGEPALSASSIVGHRGKVVGIDIAESMIEIAKQRGANQKNLEYMVLDAEAIDYKKQFDVVLSRFGLMFLPNVNYVFEKIYAALNSEGSLAFSVWDTPDKVPMVSLAFGIIVRELELPPPPKGQPNPFSMSDPKSVTSVLRNIGFSNINLQKVTVPFVFGSIDEFLRYSDDLLPPAIKTLINSRFSFDEITIIWDKIRDIALQYENSDGTLTLNCSAVCICAEK